MKKNYSGNQRPFILVLLAKDAKDRIMPLLEELDRRGLQLCVKGEGEMCEKTAAKACATVAVLTDGFSKSETLKSALLKANEYSRQIIPVLADKSEQSEIVKRALFSLNAVDADKYSDVIAFADRLMTADALKSPFLTDIQKKKSRKARSSIIGAAAAVAVVAAAYLFLRNMSPIELSSLKPSKPGIIDNYGWTEDELKTVRSLVVYGDKIETGGYEYFGPYGFLEERWENDANVWYTQDGKKVEMSENTDLSFVSNFPNIKKLYLICQSAESLPDLSGLDKLEYLAIKDIDGVDSLDFLNDIADEEASKLFSRLEITGLEGVTDLTPAKRFRGSVLAVSPQLESQAAELVESGNFTMYEIVRSDSDWKNEDFPLTSLDQIDTMMPSFLEMVRNVNIQGDTLLDTTRGDTEVSFENGRIFIKYFDTGEKVYAKKGTEKDLSRISKLENLKYLCINLNPVESLEGIENCQNLEDFGMFQAPAEDFSPLFSITSLKKISIDNTGISSLEGVENLYNLEEVLLKHNEKLEDLTPLLGLDKLQRVTISSDMEKAIESLEGTSCSFELIIED